MAGNSCALLVSEKDLHLSHLALEVGRSVLRAELKQASGSSSSSSDAKTTTDDDASDAVAKFVPQAMVLIRSPLLQGSGNQANEWIKQSIRQVNTLTKTTSSIPSPTHPKSIPLSSFRGNGLAGPWRVVSNPHLSRRWLSLHAKGVVVRPTYQPTNQPSK